MRTVLPAQTPTDRSSVTVPQAGMAVSVRMVCQKYINYDPNDKVYGWEVGGTTPNTNEIIIEHVKSFNSYAYPYPFYLKGHLPVVSLLVTKGFSPAYRVNSKKH